MTIKLSNTAPKDDMLAVDEAVRKTIKDHKVTGRGEMFACIAIYRIKDVDVQGVEDGHEGPVDVVTLVQKRLEAITDPHLLRLLYEVLTHQVTLRRGIATLPGFEETEQFEEAFAGMAPAADEDKLTEDDQLRAHVIAVHRWDPDGLAAGPIAAVRAEHANQHNAADMAINGVPAHDVSWLGYSRDDLEVAEADQELDPDDEVQAEVVDLDEDGEPREKLEV